MSDLVTLQRQFDPLMPRLAAALGKVMPVEQLMQSVYLSVERNPKLMHVDRQSLFSAAMTAAVLGLPVDNVTGQGFIIPFNVKNKGQVAQFMTGYKGMVTLAARSSFSVRGDVVRRRDDFSMDKARGVVEHHVNWSGDRGEIVGAWALAASNHLPPVVEFVPIEDLLELRARAKSAQSDTFSPWLDPKIGFAAMCGKTAKRRLARSLPLGQIRQFGIAATIDETVDERGLPAWATAAGTVEVGSQVTTSAPVPHSEAPIIIVTAGGSKDWPGLTPDLATKAQALADWVRTADSVRQLDSRWLNRSTVALKSQIKIMNEEAFDRLAEMYDRKGIELQELEDSRPPNNE